MTGDIGELDFDSKEGVFIVVRYDLLTKVTSKSYYKNLKDLNEEWEDYEELKECWYLDTFGNVRKCKYHYENSAIFKFKTKEETEKATKKLKAWDRLKDKGFMFQEWYKPDGCEPFIVIKTNLIYDDYNTEMQNDLDILFGGEE